MAWYEELGFDEDPFGMDPLERNDEFIGREKVREDLIYRIASGSMLLIVGKEGIGKTMLLKYAIDQFKGQGKVIYIDGDRVGKRLNIEKLLLKGAGTIKGGILGQKPKGMILLLDNVHNLSERNNKRIKFYFDQDYIKSVVFTTSDYGALSFTESIKDRIGKRVIKLRELSEDKVVSIIRNRLQGNSILSDEMIREIYAVSNKNLKSLVENCGKVCEFAIDSGDESVTKAHITESLSRLDGERTGKKVEECHECGEDLVQIGKEWRCPHCDTYCTNCGAFIYDEDRRCPSCGIEFDEEGEKDE